MNHSLFESIEVGSPVRLKSYGFSAVKIGILWSTAATKGEDSYKTSGRIGERDGGVVLEVLEDMAKIASITGGYGLISIDKLERIS